MKIMLTGANGFIGKTLARQLRDRGSKLVAVVRQTADLELHADTDIQRITSFDAAQLATLNFADVSCVIHLAGRAHILSDSSAQPLAEFRRVNTEATLALAHLAAAAGVKRFIFLSSIGVNGVSSEQPFCFNDNPAPVEDYALSKLEAETGLKQIANDTGMELTNIRPPLVYGPDAPGNFGRLTQLVQKNLPLPLGAVNNKRSLVALDNLLDLIITCIDHPGAANQTFLVSDDNDISTTELLTLMTKAAGNKPRLLPVPLSWLRFAAKLTGKQAVIERLCGNLPLDIRHTKDTLNWTPPVSVEEGIRRCFPAKS